MKDHGLLLVNLGSPASPTTPDVKRYLKEFLSDHNVIEMPPAIWQPLLRGIILPMRSWRSATFYRNCWTKEGSPLIVYTQRLTAKVQALMPDWTVKMAMNYGQPSITDTLTEMKKECKEIVVLSLFPFFTQSTTQTIIDKVHAVDPNIQIIDRFSAEDGYLSLLTKQIQDAWDQKDYDKLLISYHGIPTTMVKHGDPYQKETEAATAELIKRLDIPEKQIKMTYQSKFGPMPWLKPYLRNVLLNEAQLGHRNVLVAAPSFVADCLETLEEDSTQNYQVFRENGGNDLTMVPSLNDSTDFAKFIVDLVGQKGDTMKRKSLDEINGSVDVPNVYESAFWQKFLAYSGPGALVAVGYMDPGNWLTSLAGGSQYRYQLLIILFTAILIAMFMQSLSIKLGVTTRTDLAQAIADHLPTPLRIIMWLLNEVAMMATDLTGVVGTAVALNMLFKLPLLIGVILTIADVLVVLFFLHFGIRRIEFIVLAAILTVGIIFAVEVCRAHPHFSAIMDGFIPRSVIFTNHGELLISLGIVGATIMPHNIYLHSSLAQSRRYDENDPKQVKETLRFANWDSLIHLFMAFIVNALLLVLGGTLFFHTASLGSLEDVFFGLKNSHIVGSLASPVMSWLFAFALLITGLISSITSTLAGQIVMEGFINIRLPLWQRRLLTRAVTLVPILIIGFMINFNEEQFEQLIIYAQIVLSIALPFTLYPLVALTGSKKMMGQHVNSPWQTILGYLLASLVTGLNLLILF